MPGRIGANGFSPFRGLCLHAGWHWGSGSRGDLGPATCTAGTAGASRAPTSRTATSGAARARLLRPDPPGLPSATAPLPAAPLPAAPFPLPHTGDTARRCLRPGEPRRFSARTVTGCERGHRTSSRELPPAGASPVTNAAPSRAVTALHGGPGRGRRGHAAPPAGWLTGGRPAGRVNRSRYPGRTGI
jgi:hypothetical protein